MWPDHIMIILITEYDKSSKRTVVSHGIDYETGIPIVLPWNTPESFGAVFVDAIGHWVLYS